MGRLGVGLRLCAVAAVCAVVVGCGGSPGTATRAGRIPKERFIRQADELCADAYGQSQRLSVPPLPPRTPRDLDRVAAFFRAQVAIGSRELAQIQRLGVAVPGTAAQAENLDLADSLVAEMRAIAYHAHRVHPGRALTHYRKVQAISERAGALAKRFGYDVCGQGGVHRVLSR